MFRNYLVTALRNIARHKLYSFINIAGLAVGLACVIFITAVRPRRAVLRQMGSRHREPLPDRKNLPPSGPRAVEHCGAAIPAACRDA